MGNIIKNINLFRSLSESTTWYPYRVKTEKEFIDEYGGNWRREVFQTVGWNSLMMNILGIDYPEKHFNLEDHDGLDELRIKDKSDNNWTIPCKALTKNRPRIPSYKPRKIERTLESSLYKFNYKEIGIKIKNEDELIEIQDNLKKIGQVEQNLETKIQRYPNYLFVDVWEYEKSGKIILCYLTDDRDVESAFERLIVQDTSIYQHMFDISEWDKIESIMKYGRENAIPTYKPRKIERTLESTTWYPYRFRTEQEMIKKFGDNWRNSEFEGVGWNDGGHLNMDYFLGRVYERTLEEIEKFHEEENYEDYEYPPVLDDTGKQWWVHKDMIIDNKPRVPSYEPRKVDRTLESVKFNPNMMVSCNNRKDCLEFEDFLHKLGWTYPSGSKYILTNYSSMNEVTFNHINMNNKTFDGLEGLRVGDDVFNYSAEKEKVRQIFHPSPSYRPRKIDRTLEKINTKYQYDIFFIKVNNKEETEIFQQLLFDNGLSWASGDRVCLYNYDDIYSDFYPDFLEVRLKLNIIYHDSNQPDFNYYSDGSNVYDKKIYTINDLRRVEQIFHPSPSYEPRKINRTLENLNESFNFIRDNNTLVRQLTQPKFLIGDEVTIKNNGLGLHTDGISVCYVEMEKTKEWITNNIGKKLTITEFAYEPLYDLWIANCKNSEGDYNYVHQDALKKLIPDYKPRKIDRTLEGTDFENSLIKKIQSVLTKDLLVPEWADKLKVGKHHPFAGHCYAASEALYHLLGGKEKGYKAMRGKGLNNETHWWIVDKNGNILDPTAEQFYFVGLKPPYENGKGTGYLTKNPSKRAKEIISRIQNI